MPWICTLDIACLAVASSWPVAAPCLYRGRASVLSRCLRGAPAAAVEVLGAVAACWCRAWREDLLSAILEPCPCFLVLVSLEVLSLCGCAWLLQTVSQGHPFMNTLNSVTCLHHTFIGVCCVAHLLSAGVRALSLHLGLQCELQALSGEVPSGGSCCISLRSDPSWDQRCSPTNRS